MTGYRVVRILVVGLRKQDNRPEVDRVTPELAQDLALNLDPLDPFRVFRHLDGRDRLLKFSLMTVSCFGSSADKLGLAHQVSG